MSAPGEDAKEGERIAYEQDPRLSQQAVDELNDEAVDQFDDEAAVPMAFELRGVKTRYDFNRTESGESKHQESPKIPPAGSKAMRLAGQDVLAISGGTAGIAGDIAVTKRLSRCLSTKDMGEPNCEVRLDQATGQLQIVTTRDVKAGAPVAFDLDQLDDFEIKHTHKLVRGRNLDVIRAKHGDSLLVSDMINTVRTISEPVVLARRNSSSASLKTQQHKKLSAYQRPPTVHERFSNSLQQILHTDRNALASVLAVAVGCLAVLIALLAWGDVSEIHGGEEPHRVFIHDAALETEGIWSAPTNGDPFYLPLTGAHGIPVDIVETRLAFQEVHSGEEIEIELNVVERESASDPWMVCHNVRRVELKEEEEVEEDHVFDSKDAPDDSPCTFASDRKHALSVLAVGSTVIETNAVGFVGEGVVLKHPPFARARVIVAAVLMVVVYAGIVSDVVHRTLVALLGSFIALMLLTVLGEPPSLSMVISWMDGGTLALLFGMMILVHELSLTGLFQWCAVRALALSGGRMRRLLVLLSITTAILSAFLDNVTTMLLLAPVTIELCRVLKMDPVPFLISEALFSNIGGASTAVGDPPNVVIASTLAGEPGITFEGFIINVAPVTIIASPPAMMLLLWWFRNEVKGKRDIDVERLKIQYPIKNPLLLAKVGLIIGTVMILFFTHPVHHVEISWVALIGAVGVLLAACPHDLHDSLAHVEWDTLIFFAALFVLVEAVNALGLIEAIGSIVTAIISSAEEDARTAVAISVIVWISAITSAVLDNIPFTATMVPVIQILANDETLNLDLGPLVWALSLGACLGGNGTLVGASANLVTAGIAEHEGHVIGFAKFSKIGMLVLFLTCAIANVYLCLVFVWS